MNNLKVLNNTESNPSSMEVLKPVENLSTIKSAFDEIKKIKDTLLGKKDIVKIKGKNYINKKGFRKLAIAFSISTEIVSEKRIETEDSIIYDFTVRATTPIGRYMESSASSSSKNTEYPREISQTKATNRCISDLIGLGEVSYEEIYDNGYQNYSYENTDTDNDKLTQKQKTLLIRLVEAKYQNEHTRNQLYKQIDGLSKEKAKLTIKQLLEEGVTI